MKLLFLTIMLLALPVVATGQSAIDDVVKIDHTWVQGSYWSPGAYPGLGVLVDVQEDTMFGAVYGYMGNDPSFVVFVGSTTSIDPLVFEGQVFFVLEPGVQEEVVGSFRWETRVVNAAPAARLSITSNILNDSNLQLIRFAYLEEDEVDAVTGGDWTIATRILGITFGDHYAISDERLVDDGISYARVLDLGDTDKQGLVGYFPPGEGDFYAMLVQFDEDTDIFYVFFANNGNMYGRFWLLDEGETPTGDGNFFRGVADTLQVQNYVGGGDPTSVGPPDLMQQGKESSLNLQAQLKQIRKSAFRNSAQTYGFGFPAREKMDAFSALSEKSGTAGSTLD